MSPEEHAARQHLGPLVRPIAWLLGVIGLAFPRAAARLLDTNG